MDLDVRIWFSATVQLRLLRVSAMSPKLYGVNDMPQESSEMK